MHKHSTTAAAVLALILGCGAASAADLGSQAPAPVYTKAPPMAPFSWAGFYIGANGGYGWSGSSNNITITGPVTGFSGTSQGFSPQGGFGGAQFGYNWQFSRFVVGLETDIEGSGIRDAFNVTVPSTSGALGVNASEHLNYFGTVRGRVGYAFDRVLVYATGGFAYGGLSDSISTLNIGVPGLLTKTQTDVGFAVGGGVEYAFAPAWSVKGEYQYVDLQSETLNGITGNNVVLVTNPINETFHTVRIGVNYRFWGQ